MMYQHHHLPKSNEVSASTSSTSWIKAIFILGAYIQDKHTHADKYPRIRLTQFDHLCVVRIVRVVSILCNRILFYLHTYMNILKDTQCISVCDSILCLIVSFDDAMTLCVS